MQRTFCIALLASLALFAAPVAAHDFWLQPARYQAAAEEPIDVRLLIGHGDEIEPWALRRDRVVSFRSYGPQGVCDHQQGLRFDDGADGSGGRVTLPGAGTHVLALESHQDFIELEAERFIKHLTEAGLTPAIAARAAAGSTASPGRELYSRRAKAVLQVGGDLGDHVTRAIGQTLEIVPVTHPYAPRADGTLAFRVLYFGKPLEGATVTAHRLDADRERLQRARSDAQGRVTFAIPATGTWKINTIWTRPLVDDKRAEFDTVFSSLTFGGADATMR